MIPTSSDFYERQKNIDHKLSFIYLLSKLLCRISISCKIVWGSFYFQKSRNSNKMSSVATIQLVSSDLSHQETILQIVDALDHLDKITNQVFSKIQTKIDENAAKLTNLDQRVDLADLKVKKLSEMKNKATCIYSSAKYPEENNLKNYTSAFKNMDGSFKSQNEVKIVDVVKGLDIKEIKEKRRYFHLPVKKKPTTLEILGDWKL